MLHVFDLLTSQHLKYSLRLIIFTYNTFTFEYSNEKSPHLSSSLFFADTIHLRVLESSPVGTAIGSVKATDADTGKNAEVEYRIIDGDGTDMFDIITEKDTQEGIITVKKVHSIRINRHPTV